MNSDKQIKVIMSVIPTGKRNATSMGNIALLLGCSKREVRARVNDARQAGHVICGDDYGYYIPSTANELIDYYYRVRRHLLTTKGVLDAVAKALTSQCIDFEGGAE